eukprot:277193_1
MELILYPCKQIGACRTMCLTAWNSLMSLAQWRKLREVENNWIFTDTLCETTVGEMIARCWRGRHLAYYGTYRILLVGILLRHIQKTAGMTAGTNHIEIPSTLCEDLEEACDDTEEGGEGYGICNGLYEE